MPTRPAPAGWVLMSYRLPREPSTPRISVWRKLERLGVARLGDGLVGLPDDARTREQLQWLAQEVVEAGGTATVWTGASPGLSQEQVIVDGLRGARAAEYAQVSAAAQAAAQLEPEEAIRTVRRLRAELHRIGRRDFFPPPQREVAQSAVDELAAAAESGRSAAGPAVAPNRSAAGLGRAAGRPR